MGQGQGRCYTNFCVIVLHTILRNYIIYVNEVYNIIIHFIKKKKIITHDKSIMIVFLLFKKHFLLLKKEIYIKYRHHLIVLKQKEFLL